MSRTGLREAPFQGLQVDHPADPRDLRRTHPVIEPLSLDEAYLDVTENIQGIPLARDIALTIRARIKVETGLNVSSGISYNKFLAKLASDHRKPNGQYVISPETGPAFVETLLIGKFHGIGPATAARFPELGIRTGRPRHPRPDACANAGSLRVVKRKPRIHRCRNSNHAGEAGVKFTPQTDTINRGCCDPSRVFRAPLLLPSGHDGVSPMVQTARLVVLTLLVLSIHLSSDTWSDLLISSDSFQSEDRAGASIARLRK